MPYRLDIPIDVYFSWPRLEARLRIVLSKRLDTDAIERVMTRTKRAYDNLHFSTSSSLDGPSAQQAWQRDTWDEDNRRARAKLMNILVESFIVLETPARS